MATPVVESSATSNDTDRSGNTFSMNYPTGIQSGETLLAFVSNAVGTSAISFPAGWEIIYGRNETDATDLAAAVAVKRADGTETGTFNVTVNSGEAAGHVFRISGAANPENYPPAITSSASYGGFGGGEVTVGESLNNLGLLGGPFGQYDQYLGFVCLFYAFDGITIAGYPDNYSNFTQTNSGGGGSECGLIPGHRNLQGISEFFARWRAFDRNTQRRFHVGLVIYPEERYDARSKNFPFINRAAISTDAQRSGSTNFNLIIPPVEPGDILIAVTATHNAAHDAVIWPNGWTELYDEDDSGGASNLNSSCAWKRADARDVTRTIPLTVDNNPTCGVCFTVTNIPDPSPTPGDAFENSGANPGFAQTASGGSQTPSAGIDDYLWVGIYAREDDNGTYESFPTDYDGRFVVKGDWSIDSEDVMIIVCHSNDEVARTSLTSGSVLSGNSLASVGTQFVFYPGSFTDDNWWYLNWRGKGRNGMM